MRKKDTRCESGKVWGGELGGVGEGGAAWPQQLHLLVHVAPFGRRQVDCQLVLARRERVVPCAGDAVERLVDRHVGECGAP